MLFRKKDGSGTIITATQWYKNGDHPEDNCYRVSPDRDSATQFAPFLSEGEVVGHYKIDDHGVSLQDDHSVCGQRLELHGMIRKFTGKVLIVCPGDYVVTDWDLDYYVVGPQKFNDMYTPTHTEE